jgi:lipid II:glycine glycyltransferase (peptidoglycan interpeptide bridge formation enzyme)
MVKMVLKPKRPQELCPTDILFQSRYWSKVKTLLGWKSYAFDIGPSAGNKDMLLMVKPISPDVMIAYVPQGPEVAPDKEHYGHYLEALSESVIKQIDTKLAFIRYDLPWESHYAGELREGRRACFPDSRIREMRMNIGTNNWNLKKAPVDMTVAHAWVVDIDGDEDPILARMKPKTRYNIHLARRKGVRVGVASVDKLPLFYDLYCETAARNGFFMCDYRYFQALFTAYAQEHASEIVLLLATRRKDILAGAIVAISEKKAVFLYGASSTANRNLMGPYALHWEAIKYARSRQCATYDMGAVSPSKDPTHPFFGLYRFKTGFGGRIVHHSGSWDYPVKEDAYVAFRNMEVIN